MKRIGVWLLWGCLVGGLIFNVCARRWADSSETSIPVRPIGNVDLASDDYLRAVVPYFATAFGAALGGGATLLVLVWRDQRNRDPR